MDITNEVLRQSDDPISNNYEVYNPFIWTIKPVIDQKTGDVSVTVSERKRNESRLFEKSKTFIVRKDKIVAFIEKQDTSKFALPRVNGLINREKVSTLLSIVDEIFEREKVRRAGGPELQRRTRLNGIFLDCCNVRMNPHFQDKVRKIVFLTAVCEAFSSSIRYNEYYGRDTGYNLQRVVPPIYRDFI